MPSSVTSGAASIGSRLTEANSDSTKLRPVLAPQQKRSQASVERVFAATRALLEEKGFDGVTVQEVSTRAEVSVGAIYGRFQSKENLLRAVQRDWIERGRHAAGEAPEIGGAATAAEATATAVTDLA